MTGPLANLPRLIDHATRRQSSWDRTGGNRDRLHLAPSSTTTIFDVGEPGVIRHIWVTLASHDPDHLRKVVLRAYWDGEVHPSVEVPIGDFFGVGHAESHNFWSLPLQMSPQNGRGMSCWFPMPYASAHVEVANETALELLLYYYVDYELTIDDDRSLGRFHAQWRRKNPCDGISDADMTNDEFQHGGTNLSGEGNYVILEAAGKGHYVGRMLAITNLRPVPSDTFNWYGEGDDMIFVDGESFPPSYHGTGTEDYLGMAWCPSEVYNAPYHGLVMPGDSNWAGRISMYRFHIEDPIRFQR